MKKLGLVIALAAITVFGYAPQSAHADFIFSVRVAPPPLPVYVQPEIPEPGYLWTPGYWSYDDEVEDYYWVPGVWVRAPEPGLLWTPGYWGYHDGVYGFSEGYWGPTVGFYGGVSYGFGYTGVGFYGGRWQGNSFYYNRSVTNVSVKIVQNNVYNQTVVNNNITVNKTNVSYNGGTGGTAAKATQAEIDAAKQKKLGPVTDQTQHKQLSRKVPNALASANKGNPPVAATSKVGQFSGPGVVNAKSAGGPYTPSRKTLNAASVPGKTPPSGPSGPVDGKKRDDNKKRALNATEGQPKGDNKTKSGSSNGARKDKNTASLEKKAVAKGPNPKTVNRDAGKRTAKISQQPVHHPNGPPRNVAKKPAPSKKTPDEKRG